MPGSKVWEPVDEAALRELESRIDYSIMHHMAESKADASEEKDALGQTATNNGGGESGTARVGYRRGTRKPPDRDQATFVATMTAVRDIVTQKLYKSKGKTLEAYFRERWNVSRPQVYRFIDCAIVLQVGKISIFDAFWKKHPLALMFTLHSSNWRASRNFLVVNGFVGC